MMPEFVESDPSVRQFGQYVRRYYTDEEQLLLGSLLTDRVQMLVYVRFQRALLMGIEEDLALGIAILAAEIDAVQGTMDALAGEPPIGALRNRDLFMRELVSSSTDRVAGFLRRQFAPPLIFRLLGWLNRNPVRCRSKKDYVRELTKLLAIWPEPASSAIN